MELIIPLIMAIISPLIFGLMNVLDKTVVSHKVKRPFTYAAISGLVNLIIGISIALFLDWSDISFKLMIPSMIAGFFLGCTFYLYYIILSKEDISHVVGLLYFYPLIVAFLSFIFLKEVLFFYGYFGMFLILIGILMLSGRLRKIKLKISIWMMLAMIFVVALNEFFIKIATNNIPELNGIAINCIFIGLTIMPVLFVKKVRKHMKTEFKNFKWAFFSEVLTFMGVATLYYAMAGLSATVVSSLAATQPLIVLLFEKIFHLCGAKICRDVELLPKLIPISLIVLGVILLYINEILAYI